ncbi:hypothetical protein GQ53DRAFT_743884 [Thozetella sp. PMI_491]|nr:hypothetical protein GQ53DRAFT_743884 [Thozetella sp. PMI_491]
MARLRPESRLPNPKASPSVARTNPIASPSHRLPLTVGASPPIRSSALLICGAWEDSLGSGA